MSEAFIITVIVDVKGGNARNHRLEFGFRSDTRSGVESALLEVIQALKGLPREQNGYEGRSN